MDRRDTADLTRENDLLFLLIITFFAFLVRLLLFPFESGDYHQFLQGWYAAVKNNGGFAAVGMNIGDYMPTYFYLLAAFSYLPISDLAAIKTISCIADIVLAFFVMKTVNLKYKNRAYGIISYAVILLLPSVILNSAVWGQCDAIFTAALIACIYYLIKNQEVKAVIAYSVAFVFKLQAVFLAPLLLLLLIKRKVKLRTLLIFPIVYLIAILPAAVMGRNFWELITVYFSQAGQYKMIAMFLPNLYTWLPENIPTYISTAGVILAGGVVLTALYCLYRKPFAFTGDIYVSLALFFALLVPFVLPHMHERYYYLADILSVIYVFYFPKKFYISVITVLCSTYALCHNLFNSDFIRVEILGIVMLFVIILLIYHIVNIISENPIQKVKN